MYWVQRNPVIDRLAQYSPWSNPNSTRVTVEQPPCQDYPPPQRSNPYNDYLAVLDKCSEKVRLQIIQDPRFAEKQTICKNLIEQVLYSEIIPDVLQIPEGRIAFEELLACTQALRKHYMQESANEEQKIVDQTKKIQEQEQQIFAMATELKKMKGYIEEILSQKTEPDTQVPIQDTQNVKEEIINVAAAE